MGTRTWVATFTVTASLIAGCGGGDGSGASKQDYDSVREAFSSALTDFSGTDSQVDLTDGEIDCVAEAFDVDVPNLADRLDDAIDGDAETAGVYRCLSSDSIRTMFGGVLGTEEAVAAAGMDRDCILDLFVAAVDEWKAAGGDKADLDARMEQVQAEAAGCTLDG